MSSARKPNKPASLNGATPTGSSRKRKAADLDSGPAKSSTPVPKSSSRRKSQGTPRASQPVESPSGTPFTVEYPARPQKTGKNAATDDVFRAKEVAIPGLEIDYAVRPGSKWIGMRTYKNVKLSEQMFSIGSILYVNRHSPARPPPPDDAPAAELLQFDRENLWVGRVLECRADSERDVFLRIFWLYWPEELPNGREWYHGEKELVMSNAMEIIDAQSIASAAEVSEWDEKDEEGDGQLKERFWRQTLDVSKLRGKKGGLSEVRRHCTCQTEYNPDRTMFKCVDETCGIWNHEECLVANVLERTYQKAAMGTLPPAGQASTTTAKHHRETPVKNEAVKPPPHSSRLPFALERVGDLLNKARDMMTPDTAGEAEEEEKTPTKGAKLEKAKQGFPWDVSMVQPEQGKKWGGLFKAAVGNGDDEVEGKGQVVARITDFRAAVGKKAGGAKKAEARSTEWVEDVYCLRCGTVLA